MRRFLVSTLTLLGLFSLSATAAPPAREREGDKQDKRSGGDNRGERDHEDRRRGGSDVIIVGSPYPYDPYPYPVPPPRFRREQSIAFERDGTLWETRLSGGLPHPVPGVPPAGASQPARSSYWGRLAFVTPQDGGDVVQWITAEGRKPKTVTSAKWGRAAQPAWSPDDKRLAFVSDRDGNDEIYLVGEKGGKPQRLTSNQARDVHPAFASDNRSVFFISDRDSAVPALFRQRLEKNAGSAERVINVPPGRILDVATAPRTPAIAITVEEPDGARHLWLVVPDGKTPPRRLTDGNFRDDSPTFVPPDAATIIFSSEQNGVRSLFSWSPEGIKRLTDGPGDAHPVVW